MEVKLKELNMIMEKTDSLYHKVSKKLGLSDAQFNILYMIYEKGEGCSQNEFCDSYGMSKTTVNTAVKNMEKEGYIILKSIDGRRMGIYLSDSGKEIIKNTIEKVIAVENKIYDSWTDEERQLIIRLNRDYNRKLEELLKEL